MMLNQTLIAASKLLASSTFTHGTCMNLAKMNNNRCCHECCRENSKMILHVAAAERCVGITHSTNGWRQGSSLTPSISMPVLNQITCGTEFTETAQIFGVRDRTHVLVQASTPEVQDAAR